MSDDTILLDHGSGGLASQELISGLFLKHLDSPILKDLEDSAVIDNQAGKLVTSIRYSLTSIDRRRKARLWRSATDEEIASLRELALASLDNERQAAED